MRTVTTLFVASLLACGLGVEPVAPTPSIPFELVGDHAFVEVELGGEELSFVFDTAAEGVAINQATAERLGLEPTGSATVGGASGTLRVDVLRGIALRVGDLRLERVTSVLVPLGHLEEAVGRPIDGIIGKDILRGRLVRIDSERMQIEILERRTFNSADWGEPCAADMAGSPEVRAEVRLLGGETLDGMFLLDTGARGFLGLASDFVRTHGLDERVGPTLPQKGLSLTENKTENLIGQVAGVSFCGHHFPPDESKRLRPKLPTVLSGAQSGTMSGGRAGLIGNALLARLDIVFDLERERLYSRPNSHWSSPIKMDATGLQLVRKPSGRTLVFDVLERSPAAELGIEPGEDLLSLDGVEVATFTLAELRGRLQEIDRDFKLVLSRNGLSRAVVLRSRPLLPELAAATDDTG